MRWKMKTIVCVLAVLTAGAKPAIASWASGIVERVYNKTADINNYVQDTGRSISKHIQSYYTGIKAVNRNAIEYVEDKRERLSEKFSGYIELASETGKKLTDTVIRPGRTGGARGEQCAPHTPEMYLTTPQLIAMHGYPAESHTVRTDDGYLLTIHRIPHSRFLPFPKSHSRKTVLIHHGLLGSSADWVLAGPSHSLAYFLSDAGYDVWMANVRGNVYSKAHVTLDTNSHEFWNFTWHDVAQHDLPAVIDYIASLAGARSTIYYVGHSMGTTVLFALLATQPEYNAKLRAGFALAPVAFMSDIRSPVRLLAPYSNNIAKLLRLLGADQFLPQNWVLRWLSEHVCDLSGYEEAICENSLFVLCGHDQSQFNRTLLPVILAHVPAGASTKSVIHYAQEIAARGKFQQFDYGKEGNLIHYGRETPPEYNLRNVEVPMALLSAQNDWLAGESDVARLYDSLPSKLEHYVVPLQQFNHIDFLWAVDAPKLVYLKLLRMMSSVAAAADPSIAN